MWLEKRVPKIGSTGLGAWLTHEQETKCPCHVNYMPNLVAVDQMVLSYVRRSAGKNELITSRISRPLKSSNMT